MAACTLRVLLALLVVAPATAFTLTLPSGGVLVDSTATLATDASGGNYTLYAPTQAGDCRFVSASGLVPPNGAIGGLGFDRAGAWVLAIDDDGPAEEQRFPVQPRPIQIYATPQSRGSLTDYTLQVRDGSVQVPFAYVDLYLGSTFIRHARSDSTGHLFVPHEALPFAGTYSAAAYRDVDDNNAAIAGAQVTDYAQAFSFQENPPCGATPPYDAPEQHGTGPAGSSLTRVREALNLQVRQGDYQVVHIRGATNLTVLSLVGQAVRPTAVALFAGGVAQDPSAFGLTVVSGLGFARIEGTWDVESDITVYVESDTNADGTPEASGSVVIPVERDQPVRFVPVGDNTLSYMVPNRTADGRPGVHLLRFRLVDQDGVDGSPPTVAESHVRLEGDLLGSSLVTYNAGGGYWEAYATPTSSDAQYAIVATWPGKGTVRAVVDTPPDGGAKATLVTPTPPLKAGVEQDVKILVQRFNPEAAASGLCSPTPACAYEVVTDAVVELFWADTGRPVTSSTGSPYRYDPGRPNSGCGCFELSGVYYFLGVTPERSGPMAAFATVSAGSSLPRFAYAAIPVVPQPAFNPVATPAVVLAGEQTSIQLLAPGLSPATRSDFSIRILNATGIDVAPSGVYQSVGTMVHWTAALPRGEYKLWIDERLDPEHGLYGRNGTATPATISSRPAELRLAYADGTFRPELSELGDLRAPRRDTFVLGNGFGAIQRLTLSVIRPDGTPANGWVTLGAHRDGTAFGLLAPAGGEDPARFGGPQLFPPGQPTFISGQGQSYYLLEAEESRTFAGELTLRYTGAPLHLLAWGTGLGNSFASFRSTSSSLNQVQAATGSIHFIAPQAAVLNITTIRGQALEPALALGENNLVALRVRDPTGVNVLEGLEVGLTRQVFGPTQRPSGPLHYPAGATAGTAAIGIVPDATGALNVVAVEGPATVQVDSVGAICYPDLAGATVCDRPAVATTPLTIAVRHPSQIAYDPLAAGGELILDLPEEIQEGRIVDIRARTGSDPFPAGTVTAFGASYSLFNGARSVAAPAVNRTTDFPVTVQVDGYPAVTRILRVEDTPVAAAANPPPGPKPPPSTGPIPAPTTNGPSSTGQAAPASHSSTSTSLLLSNETASTHREGGLKKLLAKPAVQMVGLLAGAGVGGLILVVMRASQRRKASLATYAEPEEPEADESAGERPMRLASEAEPSPPPAPATEAPSAPAAPSAGGDQPGLRSDFEQPAGDP